MSYMPDLQNDILEILRKRPECFDVNNKGAHYGACTALSVVLGVLLGATLKNKSIQEYEEDFEVFQKLIALTAQLAVGVSKDAPFSQDHFINSLKKF